MYPRSGDVDLKVMTFNLRVDCKQDNDIGKGWRNRRRAVVNVINRYTPQIIGTQEGLRGQLLDIIDKIPTFAMVGKSRMGTDTDEFCAIL